MIQCPECGKDVSFRTKSCHHCGTRITAKEIKVDTELAGKRYKLYLVLSVLFCFLGWILLFSGEKSSAYTGGYLIAIGFIGYIVAKMLIWRKHN